MVVEEDLENLPTELEQKLHVALKIAMRTLITTPLIIFFFTYENWEIGATFNGHSHLSKENLGVPIINILIDDETHGTIFVVTTENNQGFVKTCILHIRHGHQKLSCQIALQMRINFCFSFKSLFSLHNFYP